MFLKRLCMTSLLASAACAANHDGASDVSEQKAAVRASLDDEDDANDLACEERWEDDGTCDAFCPGGDRLDCEVACTAIWIEADGVCDRDDPCAPFQDEDCQAPPEDGGIACAAFWREADGVCDWSNPCGQVQDEDCQRDCVPPGPSGPCAEIAYAENGSCEAPAGCAYLDPVDCHACLRR